MTQATELRGSVLGKGYRLGQAVGDPSDDLYEASHDRIPGRFLIRVFPPESLGRPDAGARIQRAARVASLLRDPHVVQILDFSVSGEVPAFVVMQRPDGDSLAATMSHSREVPLARAADIVESAAAALASGHRMGLVHGDLHPALVQLPNSGVPSAQVAGFGWSKELRLAAVVRQPRPYLAPEQLPGSPMAIDERADQFSLAAIAYALLAGRVPFSEDDLSLATSLTSLPRTPPALAGHIEGIPLAIDDVVGRALSFEPAERFANVREFATQFRLASKEPAEPVPRAAVVEVSAEPDAFAEAADDESDQDLALGSAPHAGPRDEGKTQVTRSPFFEGGAANDDNDDDDDRDDNRDNDNDRDDGGTNEPGDDSDSDDHDHDHAHDHDVRHRDIDVDDIRYDQGPSRAHSQAEQEHEPLPFVRSGRLGKNSPADGVRAASGRHSATYAIARDTGTRDAIDDDAHHADPDRADGGDADSGGDENPSVASSGSETTQPDGKPFVDPSLGSSPRGRRGAWLAKLQKQPNWLVGTVAGLVFVVGLAMLLARTGATPSNPSTSGPAAAAAAKPPEPRVLPIVVPARAPGSNPDHEMFGPNPAPSDECAIDIAAEPGAQIWIDEQNTGQVTPVARYKVRCGAHQLVLKRTDGNSAQTISLDLKPGQALRVD